MSGAREAPRIQALRERALQRLLVTTAIVAGVAWIPGVYAAWLADLPVIIVLDTLMWAVVVTLTVWRSLGYVVRSAVFSGLWLAFSVVLLWVIGPVGAGVAWLLALPVLTTLFFGARGAVVGVAATVAIGVTFAGVLVAGARPTALGGAVPGPAYDLTSWVASIGSVVLLAVLLSLAVHLLLRGLNDALLSERRANETLREMLDERARLEEQLVHGAKARALGDLASGVAHDLNNLLVPMLVAGSEARDASEAGSDQRRRLDLVVASAERARALSARVLAFIRSDVVRRRPVSIASAVREAVALLRTGVGRDVDVSAVIEPAAETAQVTAAPDDLARIAMNLGTNAVRAVRGRGDATGGGSVRFLLGLDADARRARLTVVDDGPGVASEMRSRLFEPYVTSQREGGEAGTGLGLTIVAHVVDSLGGRVRLERTGPAGTVFVVELPLAEGPPGEAEDQQEPPVAPSASHGSTPAASSSDAVVAHRAAAETDEPDRSDGATGDAGAAALATSAAGVRRTILVVDDEDLVRGTTALMLASAGYAVHEAADAAVAERLLDRLDAEGAHVDAVVSDVAMPLVSGVELARRVRERAPSLPVLLLSGRVDATLEADAEAAGVDALLAKPYRRRELLDAVERALAARTPSR